jgi:hypothetical protein
MQERMQERKRTESQHNQSEKWSKNKRKRKGVMKDEVSMVR